MLALNVDISGNKGRTNLVHLSFENSGSKLSNGRRNISVSVLVKEIYPILQSLCKSEGCNNFSEKSQCSMGYISRTKKATEISHPPLESPDPKLSRDRWLISVTLFIPELLAFKLSYVICFLQFYSKKVQNVKVWHFKGFFSLKKIQIVL